MDRTDIPTINFVTRYNIRIRDLILCFRERDTYFSKEDRYIHMGGLVDTHGYTK